jgi:hypothetical protein
LFLEAMRELKSQGSRLISLGVSPLARLETSTGANRSLISKLIPIFFSHFQWFYSFRSLYNFKAKFHPTEWRSAYVVHNFSRTDHRLLSVLSEVFIPQGTLNALLQMIQKKLDFRGYFQHVNSWITPRILPRAAPKNPAHLIFRVPVSLFLILLWAVMFYAVREVDATNSFSFGAMTHINSFTSAWKVWGLPGLLHWNIFHLTLNLITFLMVGITLELFCGSGVLILCYTVGHLLANSLTALTIWMFAKAFSLPVFSSTLLTEDVGASLGIWSCAGAWSYLLKRKGSVWTVFPAAVFLVGAIRGDYFQVNHITAAALGFLSARFYFGKIKNEN